VQQHTVVLDRHAIVRYRDVGRCRIGVRGVVRHRHARFEFLDPVADDGDLPQRLREALDHQKLAILRDVEVEAVRRVVGVFEEHLGHTGRDREGRFGVDRDRHHVLLTPSQIGAVARPISLVEDLTTVL